MPPEPCPATIASRNTPDPEVKDDANIWKPNLMKLGGYATPLLGSCLLSSLPAVGGRNLAQPSSMRSARSYDR